MSDLYFYSYTSRKNTFTFSFARRQRRHQNKALFGGLSIPSDGGTSLAQC